MTDKERNEKLVEMFPELEDEYIRTGIISLSSIIMAISHGETAKAKKINAGVAETV